MCQSRAAGGRRCAIHLAATRSAKILAKASSNLSSAQVDTLFKDLRREGRGHTPPTQGEYVSFVRRQRVEIENTSLNSVQKARAYALLDKTPDENNPDASTFYALRRLTYRSRSQAQLLQREITDASPRIGVNAPTARRIFDRAAEDNSPLTSPVPAEYVSSGLPQDEGSIRGYQALQKASTDSSVNSRIATERRIQRRDVSSSFISSMGYDCSDGRLEVVFTRTPDAVHAYHNVPSSVWREMNTSSAGSAYSRHVRRNPDYAYDTRQEAEDDAYARRCSSCGQFAAMSHSCPESRTEMFEVVGQTTAVENADAVTLENTTSVGNSSTDAPMENSSDPLDTLSTEELQTKLADLDGRTLRARNIRSIITSRQHRENSSQLSTENSRVIPVVASPEINPNPVFGLPFSRRETLEHRDWRNYFQINDMNSSKDAMLEVGGGKLLNTEFYVSPENFTKGINEGKVISTLCEISILEPKNGREIDLDNYRSYNNSVISGGIKIAKDAHGNIKTQLARSARCSCDEYRSNGNGKCPHLSKIRMYENPLSEVVRRTAFPDEYNRDKALEVIARGEVPVVHVRQKMIPNSDAKRITVEDDGKTYTVAATSKVNGSSLRSALSLGQAQTFVRAIFFDNNGYRGDETVRGHVVLAKEEDGSLNITSHNLRCECRDYKIHSKCKHINACLKNPRSLGLDPALALDAVGRAQAKAEEAASLDWTRKQAQRTEMSKRHVQGDIKDNYSQTFESFHADYEIAKTKIANGESPVVFMRENAGINPDRQFGVELEFDLSNCSAQNLDAIAKDLYNAGLTTVDYQQRYHAATENGYEKWSFEQDCTVDGELVSPIMKDTPQAWKELDTALKILKKHGAKATPRTGAHVHVSTATYGQDIESHAELARIVNQHEDTIYRLATNPATQEHRPMEWCAPNSRFDDNTVKNVKESRHIYGSPVYTFGAGHNVGINFENAGRGNAEKDNVEFRQWDGTLDAGIIQSHIKMSVAMVDAAERNVKNHGATKSKRENIGSHAIRNTSKLGNERKELSIQELEEDTATTRSLFDTLFTRREDKAQMTALFAATSWQKNKEEQDDDE